MVKHYRELIAWQKAMDYADAVYDVTDSFPKHELYGLVSQLRRAVVSVPSNIAEGQGRQSSGEFRQFLGNARGSLLESETQLLLAARRSYISQETVDQLLRQSAEVGRVINGLASALPRTRQPHELATDH